ncbi:MAG: hypothetical protein K6E40_00050 [Desulfovibrio sp.]|nr:hypothetical protein [Desulfovibrio sp.]
MPADRDAAIRLVCRRLGAADEGGLPAYVRDRLERELRPLLASPMVAPDDPLVLQTAEGIARDWHLGCIAREIRGSARESIDATRGWAELRQREITTMDARRDAMDQRQRDQDARAGRLDEREAALDARQASLDSRQEELEMREAAVTERERVLHANEAAMELKVSQPRPTSPGIWARIAAVLGIGAVGSSTPEARSTQAPREAGQQQQQQQRRKQ